MNLNTKTSTTGFIPVWFPVNGYFVAVENSEYSIENPKKINYRIKESNFENFKITTNKTDHLISYQLKSQPAFRYETNAIDYDEYLPIARVSLNNFSLEGVNGYFTNWKECGKWMYDALIKGRDGIDEATKTKVLELVEGVNDPIKKAKIVYEFMQSKTRYISVQVGIGGWQPIAAKKVDEVGYGDCKALTNYTKALLDIVGVESYYTVIYGGKKRNIDKDFASIQGNHVILNLPNNGKDIWLECTSQTVPFGHIANFTDDRDALVVTPEGGIIKHTTSYKNEVNAQLTKSTIQLKENGDLMANFKRVPKGTQYDDKSHLDGYTEDELQKNYTSKVWGYNNNLELSKITIENDKDSILLKENIEVLIKNYATINDKEFLFRVNVFNKNNYVPKRYRDRKLPLKIERGYKDVDEYSIKIPDTYLLQMVPETRTIETKFGSYKIQFTKQDDHTLLYTRELFIHEGLYTKEDYKLYRSFRKKIAKSDNIRIAITKN